MCYVCSSANKKQGEKCGRTFGYSRDEAIKAGVLVSCDDIGVKNARACGKMISNAYAGGNYLWGEGLQKRLIKYTCSLEWSKWPWAFPIYDLGNENSNSLLHALHVLVLRKVWIQ